MINDETVRNIENLHRLKTDGAITQEEFEKAKEKLLNGIVRSERPSTMPSPRVKRDLNDLPDEDDYPAWMLLPLKRYADFKGRSTRREYWLFQIPYLGAILLFSILIAIAAVNDNAGAGMLFLATGLILLLGSIIPQLALQARRFHDQDLSGWLAAINLIPYIGAFIVLILMAQPGTKGLNKYGPDPLQRGE